MVEPTPHTIHCPNCDKAYRWKPELGGKKVQCRCSQKFRIPPGPGGPVVAIGPPAEPEPEAVGYEVDLDESPAPAKAPSPEADAGIERCPSCGSKVSAGAVICLNCGFNLESGARVQTRVQAASPAAPAPAAAVSPQLPSPSGPDDVVNPFHAVGGTSKVAQALEDREDEYTPNVFKTRYLPICLYGMGAVTMPVIAFIFGDSWLGRLLVLGVELAAGAFTVLILFAAFMLSSKLIGLAFGDLRAGMYRLGAIAYGTSLLADAICILLSPLVLLLGVQGIVGMAGIVFMVNFLLVGAPMGAMFDLDFQEVGITTTCVIITKIALGFMGMTAASMFMA